MHALRWVGYGAFAAASTVFGVVTAAVFLQDPLLVVAGLLRTAVATARRRRADVVVSGAAALSAAGLTFGWLWWIASRIGVC
jgi:hypothetical protein